MAADEITTIFNAHQPQHVIDRFCSGAGSEFFVGLNRLVGVAVVAIRNRGLAHNCSTGPLAKKCGQPGWVRIGFVSQANTMSL